jgi:hypothetical protein
LDPHKCQKWVLTILFKTLVIFNTIYLKEMIFDFLVCSPKDHFVWVKFLMGLVNLLSSPKINAIKIHFFIEMPKTHDFFLLNIVFNKKLNYSKDIFFMILFFLRKA